MTLVDGTVSGDGAIASADAMDAMASSEAKITLGDASDDGNCQCPPLFVPPSVRAGYCQPGTADWDNMLCGGEIIGPLSPPDLGASLQS